MASVTALYKNILEQVLAIELCKKELSKKMLLLKDGKRKLSYIHSFLSYDLNKHELLEHAAVVAIHNREAEILEQIEKFYAYSSGEDILASIRKEIKTSCSLMDIVKKQLNNPQGLTFVEKRMLSETNKYVLEQAREYMKSNS